EDQRFAPEAQRALRVEFLRFPERALRFGVVEAEREAHALIEPRLCSAVRRSRLERERAEIFVKYRRFPHCGLCGNRLERRGLRFGEDQRAKNRGLTARLRTAQRASIEQGVERVVP